MELRERSYALQRHLQTGDVLIARGRSHSCGGWNRYQMCHQKRSKMPLIVINVLSIDDRNGVDKALHRVCAGYRPESCTNPAENPSQRYFLFESFFARAFAPRPVSLDVFRLASGNTSDVSLLELCLPRELCV